MKLSFYTPIAYDYNYALKAIISYYNIAEEIILAIDKDRISWSQKQYNFDDNFFKQIEQLDNDKKIKIIEDNFHKSSNPIVNETEERNLILSRCEENYVIAIDSDEILLNSSEFYNWIDEDKTNFDIECSWKTIYKIIDNKLLVTIPEEYAVIGTNKTNKYKKCRITGNKITRSPLKVLHYSWGRTKQEVEQKLNNWTHSKEFDIEKYLKIWENVNLENYKTLRNFHPLKIRTIWKRLEICENSAF